MKGNLILLFLSLVLYTSGAHAHTFTGMVGFYDGLSHPVLGIDHFLAMVSVGIVSAQIGGRQDVRLYYIIWKENTTTQFLIHQQYKLVYTH